MDVANILSEIREIRDRADGLEALILADSTPDEQKQRVSVFDGFDYRDNTHACYFFMTLNAGDGCKTELIRRYLKLQGIESKAATERMRKAIDALVEEKPLTEPWKE